MSSASTLPSTPASTSVKPSTSFKSSLSRKRKAPPLSSSPGQAQQQEQQEATVDCPICSCPYPVSQIEAHADGCFVIPDSEESNLEPPVRSAAPIAPPATSSSSSPPEPTNSSSLATTTPTTTTTTTATATATATATTTTATATTAHQDSNDQYLDYISDSEKESVPVSKAIVRPPSTTKRRPRRANIIMDSSDEEEDDDDEAQAPPELSEESDSSVNLADNDEIVADESIDASIPPPPQSFQSEIIELESSQSQHPPDPTADPVEDEDFVEAELPPSDHEYDYSAWEDPDPPNNEQPPTLYHEPDPEPLPLPDDFDDNDVADDVYQPPSPAYTDAPSGGDHPTQDRGFDFFPANPGPLDPSDSGTISTTYTAPGVDNSNSMWDPANFNPAYPEDKLDAETKSKLLATWMKPTASETGAKRAPAKRRTSAAKAADEAAEAEYLANTENLFANFQEDNDRPNWGTARGAPANGAAPTRPRKPRGRSKKAWAIYYNSLKRWEAYQRGEPIAPPRKRTKKAPAKKRKASTARKAPAAKRAKTATKPPAVLPAKFGLSVTRTKPLPAPSTELKRDRGALVFGTISAAFAAERSAKAAVSARGHVPASAAKLLTRGRTPSSSIYVDDDDVQLISEDFGSTDVSAGWETGHQTRL